MTVEQLNLRMFVKPGPLIWKDDSTDCGRHLHAGEQSEAPESLSMRIIPRLSSWIPRERRMCIRRR